MSQFDNWLADDLRVYERKDNDDGSVSYFAYSFQMDALTPVSEEELQQLRQKGVQEINELPD